MTVEASTSTDAKISGLFNGFSVVINDVDEMNKLYKMGFFGKANLSRSYPIFEKSHGESSLIRKRIFDRHKEWSKMSCKRPKKVIVVPDSEEEDEYFNNIKPEFQLDASSVQETLCLTLAEAFFLFYYIKCLTIQDQGVELTAAMVWHLFIETDKYFVQNYAVYHHLRTKNWIVKSGMKFGCDFLLYKEGPDLYHASYSVVIDVLEPTTLQRRTDLCWHSQEVVNILGLNRLCETVGKELLICQVLWPLDVSVSSPEDIVKLSINEVIMKRWIPSQNHEASEL